MPDDPTQFKTLTLHFDEPSWTKLAASLLAGGDGWQALVSNPEFDFTQPESPTNQSQIDNPMTVRDVRQAVALRPDGKADSQVPGGHLPAADIPSGPELPAHHLIATSSNIESTSDSVTQPCQ